MQNPAVIVRRALLWSGLLAGTAGIVVPKCFLCLAGYTALAASLGLGGPELCGAAPATGGPLGLLVGLAVGAGWVGFRLARRIFG